MRLVYVVSQYPTLTATFVAREMEQLAQMGHDIIICPLRPTMKINRLSGLEVSGAQILRPCLSPFGLLVSQFWLLKQKVRTWKSCWSDIIENMLKTCGLHHLTYILTVSTWLAKQLKHSKIDHIRGHFLHTEALSSMWLSHMLGVQYSLTVHTVSTYFPYSLITKAVQNAAFAICDTQEVYTFLRQMRTQDLYLIRNGINLEKLFFKGRPLHRQTKRIILAIGNFVDKKGFDILIQACDKLYHWGIPFSCRIIGDGERRPYLEKMVRKLGLENTISMPGAMPFAELVKEYDAATVFVMPSKDSMEGSDGLPTVLIESMAVGLPVIATRKAGIPDLVRNGETGLIAEPNDPESLASCIVRLLEDPELQLKFSRAGRRLIEEEYDIRWSTSKLLEIIQAYSPTSGAFHN